MVRNVGSTATYCFGTGFALNVASFIGMGLMKIRKGKRWYSSCLESHKR